MPSLARFRVALQIDSSKFGQSNSLVMKSLSALGASLGNVRLIQNPAALRELDQKLNGLTASARGKALRTAAAKGIRPARDAAKAAVPVGTEEHVTYKGNPVKPGFAPKSIGTDVRVSRDKTSATAELGVRPEAFYATEFVELGTSRAPAHPWLVPSFEATAQAQIQAATQALKASIEQAAKS